MFAHAPTPLPDTNPPATSTSARPSRLRDRGLSYLRNFNNNHSHQNTSATPSPSTRPALSRAVSTPDRVPGVTSRAPPAAPSTFLNPSAGYLSGGRSSLNVNGTSPEPDSNSDGDQTADMVRRKKIGSAPQQPNPESSRNAPAASSATSLYERTQMRAAASPSPPAMESKSPESSGLQGLPVDQMPTIKFIPHHDPRSNKPSLAFTATSRTLPHEDCVIRVGRYSERDVNPNPPPNVPSSAPVGFKSKVVSRRHCEFWCSNGQWYIRDVKSSSGTFLNHIRLSQPSIESRPFPVNDGDVVQLGIDFRGGEEQIFRCVKIRIECNRAWQKGLNNFNMSTHKQLRALGATSKIDTTTGTSTECSICLMSVAPCQSLFVAPCSHVWHFKCIRPILNNHKSYPQFICPNCRAVANLEEDVDEIPMPEWEEPADDSSDQEISEARAEETKLGDNGNPLSPSAASNGEPSSVSSPASSGEPEAHELAARQADGPIPRIAPQISEPASTKGSKGAASAPIDIPNPWSQRIEMPTNSMANLTLSGSMERRHRESNEGLLTPRNDAGPFVFDGGAGRANGRTLGGAVNGSSSGGVGS